MIPTKKQLNKVRLLGRSKTRRVYIKQTWNKVCLVWCERLSLYEIMGNRRVL